MQRSARRAIALALGVTAVLAALTVVAISNAHANQTGSGSSLPPAPTKGGHSGPPHPGPTGAPNTTNNTTGPTSCDHGQHKDHGRCLGHGKDPRGHDEDDLAQGGLRGHHER